jgi:hypothetical protein
LINYKFREDELIQEFKEYIDKTYSGHYGQGSLQSSEVIVDRGHGLGFFLGNVDKYNARYGKKGSPTDHRKDIVKVLHYALLALYEHDRLNEDKKDVYFQPDLWYNTQYTVNVKSIDDATPEEWNEASRKVMGYNDETK